MIQNDDIVVLSIVDINAKVLGNWVMWVFVIILDMWFMSS